jgi:thiamine pyrophosphate-dependent acetolactate synthase large subunit-like protein
LTTSADPAGAIVAALAEGGTRLVFGVPGGGPNLDVVGAAAAAGLRFVLARGETAATIMAATYADLTGAPGAVVVTRGPGLASAVNGIAHAALDRLPLVVIADTVPSATFLLMNPENTYHWLSIKTVVKREVSEDDPAEGQRVTDQLDRIWVKYTGQEPPYALRDPSIDERRVLFELGVVKVATFGQP